jgi:peptidylamidoglycolate lyase
MLRKIIYSLAILSGLLFCAYFLQPLKQGKGLDKTTKYELVNNWPQLPNDLKLGNPTGIDIDTNQNLVVFHRAGRKWPLIGSMPDEPIKHKTILFINKENGKLITSWGDNLFIMPHGLTVDSENNIWVTDVGLHQVFKFSHDGKLLLTLGEAKVAGDDTSHFNQPTDVAVAKDGSFYVSDGYGNSRVVKFSAEGKYLFEWGGKGTKQGEFNIPHGISLDDKGNVYVADRENNRIQVFTADGKFINQISDKTFAAICSVAISKTNNQLFAVDDLRFLKLKHRGSDVFVFDTLAQVQTRFGRSGSFEGSTSWYHDLTIDNEGNMYVGDILGNTIQKFKKAPSLK